MAETSVAVVMLIHNRLERTLDSLRELQALPERPPIVVVDNASRNGTPAAVRSNFPPVQVIELPENIGAAARNCGVGAVDTPYVAFSDDDSWWAPSALSRAADAFHRHPRLGAVHARVLAGEKEREDPICEELRDSPLAGDLRLARHARARLLACAIVFRRSAFEAVGGF